MELYNIYIYEIMDIVNQSKWHFLLDCVVGNQRAVATCNIKCQKPCKFLKYIAQAAVQHVQQSDCAFLPPKHKMK